MSEKKGISAFL